MITPKNTALNISISGKVRATNVPITALTIKLKSVNKKADPIDLKSSPIFKLVPLSNRIKIKVMEVNIGPTEPKWASFTTPKIGPTTIPITNKISTLGILVNLKRT